MANLTQNHQIPRLNISCGTAMAAIGKKVGKTAIQLLMGIKSPIVDDVEEVLKNGVAGSNVESTKDGLLITKDLPTWTSRKMSFAVDSITVKKNKVVVNVSASGRETLSQGLFNEAEYEEFEYEERYSFEEVGIDGDMFFFLGFYDTICQLINNLSRLLEAKY